MSTQSVAARSNLAGKETGIRGHRRRDRPSFYRIDLPNYRLCRARNRKIDVSAAAMAGGRQQATDDPEVTLWIPPGDEPDPEFSIVIPALNEQLTIEEFIGWCQEGLRAAGVRGEILIVDSSADATGEIALRGGARVLRTPKRGLGRAYLDALPHIRGRYVLMGDCDCTYDFRQLQAFVQQFHGGAEFVMGSRFRGYIEPGSMPPLHRYLGTPVTTWILNILYSGRFSDIHCGMRGITRDALQRLQL